MKILDILKRHNVETQEELVERLREEGIPVTQATISRDVKELKLIKIPVGEGKYRYAFPEEQPTGGQRERLRRLFRECVIDVDHSENIVVVKTLAGTANTAAEAIDVSNWEEIVGTLAGENTVLVVVRRRDQVPGLLQKMRKLMR